MKKLFFIFLLFPMLSVKGQQYRPFPTFFGSWNYQYYDDTHNPTGLFSSYILSGDTTILGTNYKKITGGALRESNKIIYFYPDTASQEYLLYNFNLNLGDTFFHSFGWNWPNSDTVIVTDVGSVQTSIGDIRTLYFDNMAMWVDGIGSLTDLYNPIEAGALSGSFGLECMMGDSGFHYPLWTTYCIFPSSVSEHKKSPQKFVSIRPNPFSSQTTLQTDNLLNMATLTIDNYLGQTVKQIKNISGQSVTLHRNNLPSGLYFIRLTQNNKVIATEKLIITD
jgi:hypothetical protein